MLAKVSGETCLAWHHSVRFLTPMEYFPFYGMPYLMVSDSGRSCFASIEILRRTTDNTVAPVAVAYTD